MKKQTVLFALVFVFFLLAATRLAFLDRFPVGMLHDEVEYALSSKTYSLSGSDLSGVHFPLSLFQTDTLGKISAVPPLLLASLWKVLPLNQFTYRLPYVLINILTGIIIIGICFQLFKNKSLALLSGILFLLNPWSFFLSRFAVDASFALFFYSLGIFLFLSLSKWKLILPLFVMLLGFFSYNGAKLLFVPVILVCIIYKISSAQKSKTEIIQGIWTFVAALLLFFAFIFISVRVGDSVLSTRSQEIVFLDRSGVEREVNLQRNQSIQNPLQKVFVNKITIPSRIFVENYLTAFSPRAWFSYGDYVSIQSFKYHGLFYLFDGALILLGIIHLWQHKRKEALFLLALMAISPIPTAVSQNGQSIVNRSFLLLPVLILFSTYGLLVVFNWLRTRVSVAGAIGAITSLLTFTYIGFLFVYFFQLPIVGQENYVMSERILGKYLLLESAQSKEIIVIDKEPRQTFLESVFYAPSDLQTQTLVQNQKVGHGAVYHLNSVTYTSVCPKTFAPDKEYVISNVTEKCSLGQQSNYIIVNERDAGSVYRIYRGTLCDGVKLTRWRNEHRLSDYLVEKMDKATFCQRWIAEPDIRDVIFKN